MPGGLTKEEASLIAQWMEEAGADAINVSAGSYRAAQWIVPPMTFPNGCNVSVAEAIKQRVKIPVIVAGRINTPKLAEEILREGRADVIAMARGLVADPDLPLKAQEGRSEEIRRCIACNVCIDRLFQEMDILCTVNPEVGREAEFDLKPAPSHKRVLVIGGGPGGMEAARVASLRGHRVSLYEEDDHLGGRIEAAFQTSFKNELKSIARYYETILRRLGVEINLGRRVTAELAFELKPDAIVMATGSLPILPDIPGIHLPHVVQAFDVLLNRVKIEGRVGVVGGGMVGCEVATFLAERGVKVVLLEMLPYVAYGIPRLLGKTMKEVMKQVGIEVMTNRKVVRIEEGFIVYKESGAKEVSLPVDWIVLATGAKPRDDLFKLLKGRFQEIYPIGDCLEARRALEAIHEGAEVAFRL